MTSVYRFNTHIHTHYATIFRIETHDVSKCTLRQAAPTIQTLSSTALLPLDSTTFLLPPALGCSAGVVVSSGFSTAADDAACSAPGCSVDDGNFRVTVIPVRSSMKSHDVRASAAKPSGLHPSSTVSTIYNVHLYIVANRNSALRLLVTFNSRSTDHCKTSLVFQYSSINKPLGIAKQDFSQSLSLCPPTHAKSTKC